MGINWKYKVENLDALFSFIDDVEKNAPQLQNELTYYKELLRSKDFNQTYSGNSNKTDAQIFHKTILERTFV